MTSVKFSGKEESGKVTNKKKKRRNINYFMTKEMP